LICSHNFHVIVDIVVRQKFKHVVRIAMESTGILKRSQKKSSPHGVNSSVTAAVVI
jgi:hypothetical protein